jgi:hypothetical protein
MKDKAKKKQDFVVISLSKEEELKIYLATKPSQAALDAVKILEAFDRGEIKDLPKFTDQSR